MRLVRANSFHQLHAGDTELAALRAGETTDRSITKSHRAKPDTRKPDLRPQRDIASAINRSHQPTDSIEQILVPIMFQMETGSGANDFRLWVMANASTEGRTAPRTCRPEKSADLVAPRAARTVRARRTARTGEGIFAREGHHRRHHHQPEQLLHRRQLLRSKAGEAPPPIGDFPSGHRRSLNPTHSLGLMRSSRLR